MEGFWVDDCRCLAVAASGICTKERVGVAPLDRERDGEHKVLLRVGPPPHAAIVVGMRVVASAYLPNQLPRLCAEGSKGLDCEAPVEVVQRLVLDDLLVAGALGLAVGVGCLAAYLRRLVG